jgi:hypothetical protein
MIPGLGSLVAHTSLNLLSPDACVRIIAESREEGSAGSRIPGRALGGTSWLVNGRDREPVLQAAALLLSTLATQHGVGLDLETAYISELGTGAFHRPHADAWKVEAGAWVPNHTPGRVAAATIFLNVPDGGGELCFIDGAVYQPAVGLAVVFPSGHEHVHWTTPVIGAAPRMTMNLWFVPARTGQPHSQE